jgi:hypothetical protein
LPSRLAVTCRTENGAQPCAAALGGWCECPGKRGKVMVERLGPKAVLGDTDPGQQLQELLPFGDRSWPAQPNRGQRVPKLSRRNRQGMVGQTIHGLQRGCSLLAAYD